MHEAQLLAVLDALPIAVMLRAADGSLLHANPATVRFLARLGLDVSHVAPSASAMMDHIAVIDEHGRPQDRASLPVVSAIREGFEREATLGYALPDGGWAWYAIRAGPLTLTDGTIGTVVTCDDVTPRRLLEEELRTAALVDPLTGLANRRALESRLATVTPSLTLLMVDIDQFKPVNDRFGHDVGDQVLRRIGGILLDCIRPGDLAARLGGDEFVLLLETADRDVAIRRGYEVRDRVRTEPWHELREELEVAVSVGVAWGARSGVALYREADEGLYQAKRAGGARVRGVRVTSADDHRG